MTVNLWDGETPIHDAHYRWSGVFPSQIHKIQNQKEYATPGSNWSKDMGVIIFEVIEYFCSIWKVYIHSNTIKNWIIKSILKFKTFFSMNQNRNLLMLFCQIYMHATFLWQFVLQLGLCNNAGQWSTVCLPNIVSAGSWVLAKLHELQAGGL